MGEIHVVIVLSLLISGILSLCTILAVYPDGVTNNGKELTVNQKIGLVLILFSIGWGIVWGIYGLIKLIIWACEL